LESYHQRLLSQVKDVINPFRNDDSSRGTFTMNGGSVKSLGLMQNKVDFGTSSVITQASAFDKTD
jgi:hypothetical protein